MSEVQPSFEEVVTGEGKVSEGLSRIKVDGGYLYLVVAVHGEGVSTSLAFVQDIDLKRYESHLRDAYTQGYKDGQSDVKAGCRGDIEL